MLFKQASGFGYKKNVGRYFSADEKQKLWQTRFYAHALRKGQELFDVIRLFLNNPVRKGLVRNYTEYLHSGHEVKL